MRSPKEASSGKTFCACLFTDSASPVRAASRICRFCASNNLPSAAICTPASSNMISPGTSSLAATSKVLPLRITLTFGEDNCLRAANAFSARLSCKYPKIPFKITIVKIAIASLGNSPFFRSKTAETTATAISITNMMLVNCSQRIINGLRPPVSFSSFNPKISFLLTISSSIKPVSPLVLSISRVCSPVKLCQARLFSISET